MGLGQTVCLGGALWQVVIGVFIVVVVFLIVLSLRFLIKVLWQALISSVPKTLRPYQIPLTMTAILIKMGVGCVQKIVLHSLTLTVCLRGALLAFDDNQALGLARLRPKNAWSKAPPPEPNVPTTPEPNFRPKHNCPSGQNRLILLGGLGRFLGLGWR